MVAFETFDESVWVFCKEKDIKRARRGYYKREIPEPEINKFCKSINPNYHTINPNGKLIGMIVRKDNIAHLHPGFRTLLPR
jgi:hypothetical protein